MCSRSITTHSSVLAWRIPGMGEPGGLCVYGVAQSRTRLKRLSSSSSSITSYITEPTTLSWIFILLFFSHLQSLQLTFSFLHLHFLSLSSYLRTKICFYSWRECPRVALMPHNTVETEAVQWKPAQVHFLILESFLCFCCCCWVASVVSGSMRPHRRQPTRLLCPWDSPGKSTGVGCRCLLRKVSERPPKPSFNWNASN